MMLTYDNLLSEAFNKVPQFRAEYKELMREDVLDADSGNHTIFGYAFTPMLINAIKNEDKATVKNMMDFLEDMASSSDNKVVEVCDYSVLEALNDEIEENIISSLIGEDTRIGYLEIKKYME